MSQHLQKHLDFATETAYLAGRLTLDHFQSGVHPDLKADDTPVTIADREAEDGRRAHVSKVEHLSQAMVAFTDAAAFDKYGRRAAWERIKKATCHRAGWGDAYGYLLVATGRVELVLDHPSPTMKLPQIILMPASLRASTAAM